MSAGGPNPVPNPYRYIGSKGYYHDDTTGLYRVGQRYYQPDLGRWTQQDPIINRLDPTQNNRYTYAGCNPTNLADPTGLHAIDWIGAGASCAVSYAGAVIFSGPSLGTSLLFATAACIMAIGFTVFAHS